MSMGRKYNGLMPKQVDLLVPDIVKLYTERPVDDENIDANTLIISHVFEHFYNPIEILKKIHKLKHK